MKRRGFTLVELLIVIVVIGVLSAMMMLSSTEAVTSARASNIVSNLRNLKTAALAWYADHLDIAENANFKFDNDTASPTSPTIASKDVLKYMNNDNSGSFAGYKIYGSAKADWYVTYEGARDSRVGQKLAGRASSVGLVAGNGSSATYTAAETGTTFNVGMKVLEHNSANDSTEED